MDYNLRIDDNFLRADYQDGEVLQHTDLNELESVVKTAINANYEDIQKLEDGTLTSGNASKLSGAELSKLFDENLQNTDDKIPTSAQTKAYVDSAISNIDLSGYASITYVDGEIESLDEAKVDKVEGKGLSTNDYTDTEKTKLSGIESGAQANVIETIKVNNTAQTITSKAVDISVPTQLSQLSTDSTHRVVTDTEKSTWNGKQNAITSGSKLNSDYVDDTGHTNKFVTEADKTAWTAKYDKPSGGIPKTDLASGVQTSLGKADTAIQPTDYPTNDGTKSGVIKVNATDGISVNISNNRLQAVNTDYGTYQSSSNSYIIGKGTLENVITGKGLTTKSYVDGLVGDIGTALDSINGEVI